MAGLIKEKLLDYALHKLSLDERSDLTIAIKTVLASFDIHYATCLRLYLSGYTAQEIAATLITTTEQVEEILARVMDAIEIESDYIDDSFIHRIESDTRYRRSGVRELRLLLEYHGKSFTAHDIGE